ncbi:hypothetical protein AXYL_04649 [Achromobacter xylosoxidans A8]|uniref:Uncharacterized protein n=1 Tax=Achromobacter xylosoxidans (strain A8) TaxID=762376 RepID=E3HIA5_ACHXA|nr:hypothetical protein [Achromobacter xylosoxidans]ADP17964.1 hypothetical protein AXYL_04649 [Achromobacter xylosoxidans A8]
MIEASSSRQFSLVSLLSQWSNAMLDFIVRFFEELLDIANFGNDINK